MAFVIIYGPTVRYGTSKAKLIIFTALRYLSRPIIRQTPIKFIFIKYNYYRVRIKTYILHVSAIIFLLQNFFFLLYNFYQFIVPFSVSVTTNATVVSSISTCSNKLFLFPCSGQTRIQANRERSFFTLYYFDLPCHPAGNCTGKGVKPLII